MDDCCVNSTQKHHLDKLRLVIERCRSYRIALNPTNFLIMVYHEIVLEHIVFRRGIVTGDDKVMVIMTLDPLLTIKEVYKYMGPMNYYHKFMNGYTELSSPIYKQIHDPG